jgi:hypothetical protein
LGDDVGLEVEPGASHMLGKCSATEPHLQPFTIPFFPSQYWDLNSLEPHLQPPSYFFVCFSCFSDTILQFCPGPQTEILLLMPLSLWDYRCASPYLALPYTFSPGFILPSSRGKLSPSGSFLSAFPGLCVLVSDSPTTWELLG